MQLLEPHFFLIVPVLTRNAHSCILFFRCVVNSNEYDLLDLLIHRGDSYPCRNLLTLRWCEFTRKQVTWRVLAFSLVNVTFSPVPTSLRKHLVCLMVMLLINLHQQ